MCGIKILVTGGTGFIGRNFIGAALRDGHEIVVLTRKSMANSHSNQQTNILWIENSSDGDLDVALQNCKPDLIVHLAAAYSLSENWFEVKSMVEANCIMTLNLLKFATKNHVPVIAAGTYTQELVEEKYPSTEYALTKSMASLAYDFYAREFSLPVTELILYDSYGVGDTRNKFLDQLIRAIMSGNSLNASSGTQFIDLVHVQDIAKGILIASQNIIKNQLSKKVRTTYTLSSGHPITILKLTEIVSQVLDKPSRINWGYYPKRKNDFNKYFQNYDSLPGWIPECNFIEEVTRISRQYSGQK